MENIQQEQRNELNLRDEMAKYLSHWRWFVLSGILALIGAFVYLRYSTNIYKSEAKLIIKQEAQNPFTQQLSSALTGGGVFGSENSSANELEILKSRTLNKIVIDSLDLTTEVFFEGRIKSSFLYPVKPFTAIYIPYDKEDRERFNAFNFTINYSDGKYRLFVDSKEVQNFSFDKNISLEEGVLRVKKLAVEELDNGDYNISVFEPIRTAERYRKQVNVNLTDKWSDIIDLEFTHQNKYLAADYINTLIYFYNQQSKVEKRFVAKTTSEFISNRLDIISSELGDVEKNVENYKSKNNITDVESEIKSFISNLSDFEKKYVENETKIKITQDLIRHIANSKTDDLVPSGMLSGDLGSESAIAQINNLIIEKQKLSVSSTDENPAYISLENQIKNLKNNLLQSLRTHLSALQISKNDLERQEREIQSKLNKVPTQEREFRIIERQQKVKEALYLFLLQKREENNISLAVVEDNAKIVDKAIPSDYPISPKKAIVILAGLILGLIIPFAIIYLKNLLDNKVKTRNDLEMLDIPFLGDVPTSESSNQLMDFESRSASAEAIRIVRTNLEFILTNKSKGVAKKIFVTSTLPSEGKSFVCANLAATIALSGKKVLLIGLDLRNPRVKDYLQIPTRGLTNFIMNNDESIDDYIVNIPNYPHFDVLPSGNIPPNPAELLMSNKIEDVFDELSKIYDYILVDTAPVAPVTDTLLISKYADMFVYIVRANKLEKKLLEIPFDLYKKHKLPNMSFVLNDTDTTKGYGYSYGYGETHKKQIPLWKKIFGIK